jgi:hypothetical protein
MFVGLLLVQDVSQTGSVNTFYVLPTTEVWKKV